VGPKRDSTWTHGNYMDYNKMYWIKDGNYMDNHNSLATINNKWDLGGILLGLHGNYMDYQQDVLD
jgi:hypothetical protein